MKTATTLRIGRVQYRQLAELAKQAGCCLELTSVEELGGNWGMYTPFAAAVLPDVSQDHRGIEERVVIQLATTVNTEQLRAAQRPEIDWSQLHDEEIYKFIVAHEIGHFLDNHCVFDVWSIKDQDIQATCYKAIKAVNEVLADRYAWSQIRPGEAVPLCENGKRLEQSIAESMFLLNKYAPRTRRAPRSLPSGQYSYVPQSMLMTDSSVAYVGTKVSPELIDRTRNRRRIHRRDTRVRI